MLGSLAPEVDLLLVLGLRISVPSPISGLGNNPQMVYISGFGILNFLHYLTPTRRFVFCFVLFLVYLIFLTKNPGSVNRKKDTIIIPIIITSYPT